MDTYVTLSVLLICCGFAVVNLLKAFYQHEKKIFILTIFLLTTRINGGIINTEIKKGDKHHGK